MNTAPRKEAQGRGVSRERLAGRVRDALDSGGLILTAGPGSGKTTILDQALSDSRWPIAWVSCSDTERVPGALLIRIVDTIARAAPGASDALAERLAAGGDRVDPLDATRELVGDLARLLVEPLVLVVDDAEHLEGATESLRLLNELIRAELPLLHVAVASRRALGLRVAKPRAAGRLTELGAADLAFDPEECTALLQMRTDRSPSAEQIDELMAATEGWPLGIALGAGLVERRGAGGAEIVNLSSAPDLRSYLSEELLDSLDPKLRMAAIDSSVVRILTPEAVRALGLPERFEDRIERAGLLVRHVGDDGAFAYHPLLRDFLLERLHDERTEDERRQLHAAVAPTVAGADDTIAAIGHWIEAESWAEAVAAIEREGLTLVRTSPELVRGWLAQLPDDVRHLPTLRALEGQLEWGAGNNPGAIAALRDAVVGFNERPNPPVEWIARSILVDTLFATGEVDEIAATVEGWDAPTAEAAGGLAPAAAIYAAICLAGYGRMEQSDRLAEAANRHPESGLLAPLEALRVAFRDGPGGGLHEARDGLEAGAEELERFDPLSRRPHLIGAYAVVLGECGRREDALGVWIQIREEMRGGLWPVLADATHAWCALLHAQAGRLAEAEVELAQHRGEETGYRAFIGELAPAVVAALRGDAEQTISAADRALAFVAGGPILFRCWVGAALVPALVAVGKVDRAEWVIEHTLVAVDEILPGPSGQFQRGCLLALRAWVRHVKDAPGVDDELGAAWVQARESLPHLLRREWERLEAVIWSGLEREALEAEPTMEALSTAFPGGIQLIPFLDHPVAAVRAAALGPAVSSGDPGALEHLERLEGDPDPDLAGAASRAAERLATSLPPMRFELLGKFGVGRGSWEVRDDAWARPIDARLVRFLLVHLGEPVPEDLVLDALWPGTAASKARRSLRVASSRARKVLDPPGVERSAIESGDRTYRLVLGERDVVDAEEFRSVADAALSESGVDAGALLERARSLWGGEPLPEERYSDWATTYRERLIDRYIAVLTALIGLHERAGEHAHAVDVARELVDLDPLNEGGHRALIASYARTGRTGYALRQYMECRRALVEELGVEPSEATSQLQARILAGEAV